AGGVFDSGRVCRQRNDRAAFQKPNQARAVVAAQPPIRRVWPLRHWRQTEQVRRRPAERLGLTAPLGEEALAVLDGQPPSGDVDQGRGPQLEMGENLPIALRLRQLDDLDLAGDAARARPRSLDRPRLAQPALFPAGYHSLRKTSVTGLHP